MSRTVEAAALRPGDVLLMRGKSGISDLVAWFGDSIYSHAAIVVDGGQLVEAAPPASRIETVAGRLASHANYAFVDAWRPTRRDGRPLAEPDRVAIAREARALIQTPYPVDEFVQMGLFATLRNRIPADPRMRLLLRRILDHVLREDPQRVTCSELVYRALAGAGRHGGGDVEPAVVVAGPLDLPFPPVDIAGLLREWENLRRPGPRIAPVPATLAGSAAVPVDAEPASGETLEALFADVRERRGLGTRPQGIAGAVPPARPNPRNVLPVDLESSPTIRFLGRLPLAG